MTSRKPRPVARAFVSWALVVCVGLLLTACGAAPRALPELRSADRAQGLDGAIEAYYTGQTPAALRAAVAKAASLAPDSAAYHEIAADLAGLQDDPRARLRHLVAALLDAGNAAPLAHLNKLASVRWTLAERAMVADMLEALAKGHPDPATRDYARWMWVHHLHLVGEFERRDAALAQIQLRLKFALIGTWDNDQGNGFDAEFPPERGVDFKGRYPGKLLEIGWNQQPVTDPRGKLDLRELLHPSSWQIAYAASGVHSETAQAVELRLATSDPVKVWVNDQLVFEGRDLGGWLFDGVVIPIKLNNGYNNVLVKTAQRRGGWLLVARLTGADGAAVSGVKLAPADGTAQPSKPLPQIPQTAAVDRRIKGLKAGTARAAVHWADWAGALGLKVVRVKHSEQFQQAHPGSLVGRQRLMVALWDAQERGRTSDMLMALNKEVGPELGYFRLRMARFWSQQKLESKARDLLVAQTREHPKQPSAYLDLARSLNREGWNEARCEALEGVDQRWPDWPYALYKLGDCYEELRFYPRARAIYTRLLRTLPNDATALKRLHWLTQGNDDYPAARGYALRLTEGWPHLRASWQRLGETLRRMGDVKGAEIALEHLVKLAPLSPTGYRRLAALERQADKLPEALKLWRASLARDPDNQGLSNRLSYLAPDDRGSWAADVPDQAAIDAAVAAAVDAKPDPASNVLYLLDDEVSELGADGSSKNIVTSVALALNQAGRDRLTRMSARGGGRVRIMNAYGIDPEGKRMEASSIRGRTVRFRQLKIGSIIVFQYRIDSRPDGYLAGHMARQWWFQSPHAQTRLSRWVLWLPKEMKLLEEGQGTREERVEGGQRRVAWSAKNTAPVVIEPGMPTLHETASHIVVSTVPDWQTFWTWEKALLRDAFRESPELRTLAADLVAGAKTTQEKVDRIHAYLMTNIRYQQDYERRIAGVKPHAAPVVVARQYGDCKDKAVLFITLARLAGIKVHFALVRTRDAGPVRRGVPMQQFNHAIVYVPAQEGFPIGRFYDPTVDALDVQVLRHDDQGTWSLVFDPVSDAHTWRKIPYQRPEVDLTANATTLTLDAQGAAKGRIEITARGRVGEIFRRGARNPEQMGQLLEQQVSRTFAGGRALKTEMIQVKDVMTPAKVAIEIEAPSLGRREGRSLRLKLPIGWSASGYFVQGVRRHPVLLGSPRQLKWTLDLTLPAGAKISRLPSSKLIDSECISLERKVSHKGRIVHAEHTVTIKCERISVEKYAEHKARAELMTRALSEELVLSL